MKIFYYFNFLTFTLLSYLTVQIFAFESNKFTESNNTNNEDDNWYWNKEDYPNPYERPPYCRRSKPSFVCDPDQILTKKEANRLDEMIMDLTNVSICFCTYCPPDKRGINIGIALMKHVYKDYNVRELQNAENFATYTRNRWNLGVCDNNMLIVLITADDQIAVSQGSMTKKVFPQFIIEETILNNKIHFINGNYFQGLMYIISNYSNVLKNNIQYSPNYIDSNDNENPEEHSSSAGLVIGLIIGFALMLALIMFVLFYVRKRFSDDGSKFQFKGMLSKGYWLNKNERLRPVSVNPINTVGSVYEPCSIEEANDNDADKRLREKLSQISECSSDDEEEIGVIEHQSDNQTKSMNDKTNSNIELTSVDVQTNHPPMPSPRSINHNINSSINT